MSYNIQCCAPCACCKYTFGPPGSVCNNNNNNAIYADYVPIYMYSDRERTSALENKIPKTEPIISYAMHVYTAAGVANVTVQRGEGAENSALGDGILYNRYARCHGVVFRRGEYRDRIQKSSRLRCARLGGEHIWIGEGAGKRDKKKTLDPPRKSIDRCTFTIYTLKIGPRCVSPIRWRDPLRIRVTRSSRTHRTHLIYIHIYMYIPLKALLYYRSYSPPTGAGMLKTLLAHTRTHKREHTYTRVVYITSLYYTAFDIVSDRDVRRMRHSSRFSRRRRRCRITIYYCCRVGMI